MFIQSKSFHAHSRLIRAYPMPIPKTSFSHFHLDRSCQSSPGRMTYTLPLSLGATQTMGALGGGRGWPKEQNPTKEISSGNSGDLPGIGFWITPSKDEKPMSFKTKHQIAKICRLVQKRVCLLLSGVYPKAFPRADQKVSISIQFSF